MTRPARIKPPGSGRKPRTGTAGSMVGLRLDASERARYQSAATQEGVSLGEWIRSACQSRVNG